MLVNSLPGYFKGNVWFGWWPGAGCGVEKDESEGCKRIGSGWGVGKDESKGCKRLGSIPSPG